MLISKSVVYRHIVEVRLDMFLEKGLNHHVIKLGVNKYCSKIGFHHVRQTLLPQSASIGTNIILVVKRLGFTLGESLVASQ